MALATELITVLDIEEEPLAKRLKTANSALKSTRLPIHSKEVHLLKWLMGIANTGNKQMMQVVNDWLHSEEIVNISKTDVSQENIFEILKVIAAIASNHNNNNLEPVIVESFNSVLNNKTFQHYFKHDLKLYFKFTSQVIEHIQNADQLLIILNSEGLLNRLYFTETKSYKYFCKICLPAICQVMNSMEIYVRNEVIGLVNKCIFEKSSIQLANYLKTIFEQYDTTETFTMPKILINAICDHYNNRNGSAICFIYSSVCSVFELKFEFVYQFTVLLLQICGFDLKEKFKFIFDYDDCDYNTNFSISIANEIYKVLTTVKTNVDDKINEIDFSMLTQLLLSTIMNISNPSKSIMEIFTNAINVEPLILEPMLNSILPYVMLCNIDENFEEYKTLLINIISVSAKLCRMPNLIANMLPAIKVYPSELNLKEDTFNFKGNMEKISSVEDHNIESILSQQILDCFSTNILDLQSWQIINIFKTFTYHLRVVGDDLIQIGAEGLNHTYIEILCQLFCTFLSTVKITEHTPDSVVNKFVKCMMDLKNILQVLGNRLLELNHNQYIMRAYLNICYTWGELSILLKFYSSASSISNLESNNNDYQVCCISYIHSYLTAEQWSSVTERITNFGEKPCKSVMQSLQLQSIKAIFLFENRSDDIDVLFLRNLTQNSSLGPLLSDPFVTKILMPKLPHVINSSLAKELIGELINKKNYGILQCNALESPEFAQIIILNVLIKIAKCGKHKEEQTADAKELLTTLFQKDTETILFSAATHYDEFKTYFSGQSLNENKLKDYLNLLQKLPIMSLNNNIQLSVFLYISALLEHLIIEDLHIKLQVEQIIIGMIQFPSELLVSLQPKFILPFMLNSITDYKSSFVYWLENMLRNNSNFMQTFVNFVDYSLKNFQSDGKIRICVVHFLNNLNKSKKHTLYIQFKNEINEQRNKMYRSVIQWLSSNEENMQEVLHFYALSLKHCLSVDNDQKDNLKGKLDQYIKIAVTDTDRSNTEAKLLLFSTALTHKNQLAIVNDQVILSIWKTVQTLKVKDQLRKEYSQLIVLIFEHISNEHFAIICEDLCNILQTSLSNKDNEDFTKVMIIINGVLQCSLNPAKIKVWQNKVEEILAKLVDSLVGCTEEYFKDQVISFEINIIHANHFMITSLIIDEILRTIFLLFFKRSKQLTPVFKPCVQILNLLLKHRMSLMTDRLPSFFQQYRILLTYLCEASDSSLNLSTSTIKELADYAYELEKLTKVVATCGRHVQRIAGYLLADILQHYETISMYSSVKIHIDNCAYSLMSLFDQHSISFLMRSLSIASTELFKYMLSNYKRYYRFTGKV